MIESIHKTIELWDLCNSNVYIKIKNPFREEFFDYLLKISGGRQDLSKKIDIFIGYPYELKKGLYFTSLRLINKFLNILPENKKSGFKRKIENNIEEIKIRSRSSSIKNPEFPIRFSPRLARIAGHLVGDGGIKNDLIVHYSNTHSSLLNQFRKDILEVFGDIKHGRHARPDKAHVITIWFPRLIGLLLIKMFGEQVKTTKHIPKIIFEADNESKASFLSALFDDEGSVRVKSYRISLEMTGKKLVEDIKKLLRELEINTGKIAAIKGVPNPKWGTKYQYRTSYKFYIHGKLNLIKFSKLINFTHPEKKKKLRDLIQKYQR